MARSKKVSNLEVDSSVKRTPSPSGRSRTRSPISPESERPVGPLSVVDSSIDRDIVKVNNASSTELKNACDDAVKRFLSRPELFKQNHRHTDVRLALGWLSVFVAAGTALYGYKIDFETSKPMVSVGLAIYIALSVAQTLYAYFVEGNTIFIGKRKTLSKRIISEHVQINSSTIPASKVTTSLSPSNSPSYQLAVSYMRSTNAGKSLLAKGRTKASQPFGAFFDDEGIMHQEAFEQWVGQLVEEAMDGKLA
ncbi:hypothetical protein D9613_010044 [Agrocybe pediades]|uniref:Signal peptidase complex subunit 2 n=1 Tax=Agrocybe pediades TaxID=84607 RepID=A0A8H4QXV4_9AGAR|nr:hypothetical protein D9613_010044 [Agrocybe pediades]